MTHQPRIHFDPVTSSRWIVCACGEWGYGVDETNFMGHALPFFERVVTALKRMTDEMECTEGIEHMPHLVWMIDEARAALAPFRPKDGCPRCGRGGHTLLDCINASVPEEYRLREVSA